MSMRTEIVDDRQRGAWNEYVAGNDKAIAWQLMEWNDLLAKHHPVEFYPVAVFEEERIRGVLPLYRVKSRGGSRLISVAYAVAGGIVADGPAQEQALLEKAVAMHHELGTCGLTLKQYKYPVTGALRTDDSYYNSELSLSGSPQLLWERVSDGNRALIAESDGENVVVDRGPGLVREFFDLLLDHHHRRGVPCCSRGWIQDLFGTGMYDMALLRKDGEPVAGTMIKTFKKTVSFPFTCVRAEHEGHFRPVFRLYWELIRGFAGHGYEIFHSGRIPKNDETDRYRLGWGGTKYGYFYQYYPATTAQTEFQSRRNAKRSSFEKAWKLAPRPLVRALGPYVVRQFP